MRRSTMKIADKKGFTLIEVMISMMAMSIAMGMLYSLALGMSRLAHNQDSSIMIRQEARFAMQTMVKNIRMSQRAGLRTNDGAGNFVQLGIGQNPNLAFQQVADMNGSTNVMNADMTIGVTPMTGYTLDFGDANGDGITNTQLVQMNIDGTVRRVLANHVSAPVASPDLFNAPQGGLIFQDIGGGSIQITLIMRHRPDPTQPMVRSRLDEIVTPRN